MKPQDNKIYEGRPVEAISKEKCPDCGLVMMNSETDKSIDLYCPDIRCGYTYKKWKRYKKWKL